MSPDRCADCGRDVYDDLDDCVTDGDDLVCLDCNEQREMQAERDAEDRRLDDPRHGQGDC